MTTALRQVPDQDVLALVSEIVAAHAAGLARLGKYCAAEELIVPLLDAGQRIPRLLDLLARIRVQQGRIDEAASLWQEALAMRSDPVFQTALGRVSRNRHPRTKRLAATIVIGLGIVSGATGILIYRGSHVSRPRPLPSTDARIVAKRDPLNPEQFRSTRTISEAQGESVKIAFTEPLFSQGVRLTRNGKLMLVEFANTFRPYAHTVDVTITGKTDSVPVRKPGPYSDNTAVGLMRAVAAYNEIRRYIPDLPTPRFVSEVPSPSGERIRDQKRRTVAIIVAPAAAADKSDVQLIPPAISHEAPNRPSGK